jgi:hypothetical protein
MYLFGRLGVGPVDVCAVPQHRLVDTVGAAHLVAVHPAKLYELHVAQGIHVWLPGGSLLENANSVRPGYALVLLPPAIGELLELSVGQTLAERHDTARHRRVEEEVPRVLRRILGGVDVREQGLYR